MTVSLLKSMRVQLKVEQKGKGPWLDVLAITGPIGSKNQLTGGHFLIFNPDRVPQLHWLAPAQIEDVEYELASWPTAADFK